MADNIITSWGFIKGNNVTVDGKTIFADDNFTTFVRCIKALYKKEQLNYPKFYKLDNLSKLGFLTAAFIINSRNIREHYNGEELGVVITNSSSSLDTDIHYQETISDSANYFPSPSVFVYTLPNILIGEICIRNGVKGENAFLVTQRFDAGIIFNYVDNILQTNKIQACIC